MMELTHLLEKILYLISSSLYLPVLLVVTLLAAYSIYATGRLFQEWVERKRIGSRTIADFRQGLSKTIAQRGNSTTPLDIELELLLQT